MQREKLLLANKKAVEREWLAWAAGIIDGEGCILLAGLTSRDRNMRIHVVVVNTDRRMLDRLTEIFETGNLAGPYAHTPRRKPIWRWTSTGFAALDILRRVRPWLVTKGERADIAAEVSGCRGDLVAQQAIRERIAALNRRGVA